MRYRNLISATSKQMLLKILVKVFGLELLPKSKTELQGSFKGVSCKRLPIAVHTGEDMRIDKAETKPQRWRDILRKMFPIQMVLGFL